MQKRALTLDPEQVAPAGAFDYKTLGRAGEKVGDHRVDRDPPPRDRDPGLAGRDEDRAQTTRLRLAVELERDGHLPDRAVRADREHDLRVELEVLPRRDVQVGRRLAQVAELDAVPARELDEPRVVGEELMQAVLDVEPLGHARAQQLTPGRGEAASLRGDADESSRRVEAERVVDATHHRDAVLGLTRALRVEDRDRGMRRVAEHSARRLPVVRVAGLALSEDQISLRAL